MAYELDTQSSLSCLQMALGCAHCQNSKENITNMTYQRHNGASSSYLIPEMKIGYKKKW